MSDGRLLRSQGGPAYGAGDIAKPAHKWQPAEAAAADDDDDGAATAAVVPFDPKAGAQVLSPHEVAQRIGYANSLCVALASGNATPREVVEWARCMAEFAPHIAAAGDVHNAICGLRDEVQHLVHCAINFQAANFDEQSTQFAVELTHNVQQMGALMLNQLKDSQDENFSGFANDIIVRLNQSEGSVQTALAVLQSATADEQSRLRHELGQLVTLKNEQLTSAFMASFDEVKREMKGVAEDQQLMRLRVDAKLAEMEALTLDALHRATAESQAETDKRIAQHSVTLLKSSQAMVAQVSSHARDHADNVAKMQEEKQKLALACLARQMQSALETESVDSRALVLQQANQALEEVAEQSRSYVNAMAKQQAAAMSALDASMTHRVEKALALQRVENLTQHIQTQAHTDQKTHEVYTKTLGVVHGVTSKTADAQQARLSGLTDTVEKLDGELTTVRTVLDEVLRTLGEHEKRTASMVTVTKLTNKVTDAETGLRDVAQRLAVVESTCGHHTEEITLLRDAIDTLTTMLHCTQEELRTKDHFTFETQRAKSLQRGAAPGAVPPVPEPLATVRHVPQAQAAPPQPSATISNDGAFYRPGACIPTFAASGASPLPKPPNAGRAFTMNAPTTADHRQVVLSHTAPPSQLPPVTALPPPPPPPPQPPAPNHRREPSEDSEEADDGSAEMRKIAKHMASFGFGMARGQAEYAELASQKVYGICEGSNESHAYHMMKERNAEKANFKFTWGLIDETMREQFLVRLHFAPGVYKTGVEYAKDLSKLLRSKHDGFTIPTFAAVEQVAPAFEAWRAYQAAISVAPGAPWEFGVDEFGGSNLVYKQVYNVKSLLAIPAYAALKSLRLRIVEAICQACPSMSPAQRSALYALWDDDAVVKAVNSRSHAIPFDFVKALPVIESRERGPGAGGGGTPSAGGSPPASNNRRKRPPNQQGGKAPAAAPATKTPAAPPGASPTPSSARGSGGGRPP